MNKVMARLAGGVVWLTLVLLVTGTLKGYDALMNLVLDDVQEVLRGELCLPLISK
jgi:LSM domain